MSGELFQYLVKKSLDNKTTGSFDYHKGRKLLNKLFPKWKTESLNIDDRSVYWETHNYFDKVLTKYKIDTNTDEFGGPYDEDVEWFIGYLQEEMNKISSK
jgi:hypothetical protein